MYEFAYNEVIEDSRQTMRARERAAMDRVIGMLRAAQQAVASTASSLIAQGQDSLTNVQAALGSTQSAVTDANSSMSSQSTILQKQIDALDNVDPNATAAQINSLTNQIQMAYEFTARLQQMNLAQYLPVP